MSIDTRTFTQQVDVAIREALRQEGEVLLESALEDIRKKLRERLAQLVLTVLDMSYEMARGESVLTIRVKLAKPEDSKHG